MSMIEILAKEIYDQRMRGLNPNYDNKTPIHPRLGLGRILQYEELPDDMKIQERKIAQAALDLIRVLDSEKSLSKNIEDNQQRDPSTITNEDLIRVAHYSSDPIKSLMGERLLELKTCLKNYEQSVLDLSLKFTEDLKEILISSKMNQTSHN